MRKKEETRESRAEQSRAEQSRAEQSRATSLDVLKAICAFLVVCIHRHYFDRLSSRKHHHGLFW